MFFLNFAFILLQMMSHNDTRSCPVLSISHCLFNSVTKSERHCSARRLTMALLTFLKRSLPLLPSKGFKQGQVIFCSRARICLTSLGFKAAFEIHHPLVLYIYTMALEMLSDNDPQNPDLPRFTLWTGEVLNPDP